MCAIEAGRKGCGGWTGDAGREMCLGQAVGHRMAESQSGKTLCLYVTNVD